MKNNSKRVIGYLTAMMIVVCVIFAFPTVAGAATGTQNGFAWKDVQGGIEITKYTGSDTDVVIPSTINGKTVVGIGGASFESPELKMKSLVIPDSVTYIGSGAFSYKGALVSVKLSSNLKTIQSDAFNSCSSLVSVTTGSGKENSLPASLNRIEDGAFFRVGFTSLKFQSLTTAYGKNVFSGSALETVTLPDYTILPDNLLAGCESITSVSIPSTCKAIGNCTFRGCKSLTSITIPAECTTLGNAAFSGCKKLSSFTIGSNSPNTLPANEKVGDYAFADTALTTVNFQTTDLGKGVLKECASLVSATLPDTLTVIPQEFFSCSSLQSILIPGSCKEIGANAFYGAGLSDFTIGANAQNTMPYGVKIGDGAFGKTILTAVTLETANIGKYAFEGCKKLTGVTLPDSLTSVPDHAFEGCTVLNNVVLPGGCTAIGKNAFYECSALDTIKVGSYAANILPATLAIGEYAFARDAFTSIEIRSGSIGADAFLECDKLVSAVLADTIQILPNNLFRSCLNLKNANIPANCVSIGSYAFENTPISGIIDLKNYTALTSIGAYAFSVTNITGITLPDSLKSLGTGAFLSCANLTGNVAIPTGCKFSGYDLFKDCAKLQSVTLPDTAEAIGPEMFSGCANLTTVNIPNGVSTVGTSAFKGCTLLNNISLPDSVTALYANAFDNCTSLNTLKISKNLKTIGEYAFRNTPVNDLTFSDTLNLIDNNAFYGCASLKKITFLNKDLSSCSFATTGLKSGSLETTDGIYCIDGSQMQIAAENDKIPFHVIYQVSFNNPIGSKIENQYIFPGDTGKVIKPADPQKSGYTFAGWYTDTDYTADHVWDFNKNTVKANTKLYAKVLTTITADVNNSAYGTISGVKAQYIIGDTIRLQATPKDGYYFVNWTQDGKTKTKDSYLFFEVSRPMKLVANFEKIGTPAVSINSIAYNMVSLSWKPVKGAVHYNVYRLNGDGYSCISSQDGTSYKDTNIYAGRSYSYIVKAVSDQATLGDGSAPVTAKTGIGKITGLKMSKASKTSIKLTWNSVAGAQKYEVYIKTGSGKYSLVATPSTVSYTNKSLKKGKTYTFKVRAYRMVDFTKVYGDYTATTSIKL